MDSVARIADLNALREEFEVRTNELFKLFNLHSQMLDKLTLINERLVEAGQIIKTITDRR